MFAFLFLVAAEPVPTFTVVNKCPPAFTVVNKVPAPVPVQVEPVAAPAQCSGGQCAAPAQQYARPRLFRRW